jgi:uncharacterized membrane protein
VAFVTASVAWAAMLPLVPFLASRAHASALGTLVVVTVYGIGGTICHQLPERSYHLWTAQMPVCARCAGIYAGAAIAAVVAMAHSAPLKPRGHLFRSAALAHTGAGFARTALVVAALPAALTLAYEWTTGQTPGNLIRMASGIPIGAVVAWLALGATREGAAAENQVN